MKKAGSIALAMLLLLGCSKDDDTQPEVTTSLQEELPSSMKLVIDGDTLHTDFVFTRFTGAGRYQINAQFPEDMRVMMTFNVFIGESNYITGGLPLEPLEAASNRLELRNLNGEDYTTAYGYQNGFINVYQYDPLTKMVSGTFGGNLTSASGEAVSIDSSYFEFVMPLELAPESGKVSYFVDGALKQNRDFSVSVSPSHRFFMMRQDEDDDYLLVELQDITSMDFGVGVFRYFGFFAYCLNEWADENLDLWNVQVDYDNQTVSGVINGRQFDTHIVLNEVPVSLPQLLAEEGVIKFLADGVTRTFDLYEVTTFTGTASFSQTVELVASNSSNEMIELSLSYPGTFTAGYDCFFRNFSGQLRFFANANDADPTAVYSGPGGITAIYPFQTTGGIGFATSEGVELTGLGLTLNWLE